MGANGCECAAHGSIKPAIHRADPSHDHGRGRAAEATARNHAVASCTAVPLPTI
ncbi:hypothetical protein BGZ61DRAFT_180272 [Ilyonectria robusta]|uniref:uncharacterized protein n=1 Tax=Ilyonectria robusta TaxID=1079257 RepID=UPI001E8E6468|nr:uncharacterized protein BGZ61DRAFT_180272 [Ilyonectria robusta]KAH8729374.1 hypothetical protein BGZ61DRAFT_180272 [Ilyonectria robusta]